MRCTECFPPELPAELLAEGCTVRVSYVSEPVYKALVTFTCSHGGTRRHAVYPQSSDWGWLQSITPERKAA